MTNRADILEALAERVEEASGPDRELDERVGMVMGLKNTMRVGHECLGTERIVPVRCPAYTASVDAAMTLRPGGWTIANLGEGDDGTWWAELREGYLTSYGEVALSHLKCATPALALLAACLRAHASMEKNNG